jgi:hypothetical protein
VKIMRALVKLTLGHSLVTTLADDIVEACETLKRKGWPARDRPPAGQDRDRLLGAGAASRPATLSV